MADDRQASRSFTIADTIYRIPHHGVSRWRQKAIKVGSMTIRSAIMEH